MDLATIVGLLIAFGSILGGQVLEGGHIGSILQPTAAIIVFGGTIGAVCIQFPGTVLKRTLGTIKQAFLPKHIDFNAILRTMVGMSQRARRDGLVALEKEASAVKDPFLKGALEMAIDGVESKQVRAALELQISREEESGEGPVKVLEACGGYSPTVGIIGAVLGLIHVMENLSDPSKLGSGIAVAFVATVYGVVSANLIFLPLSGKLKQRHHEEIVLMEAVTEGVCAIADGENPRYVERKLSVYIHERQAGKSAPEALVAARAQA